MNHTNPLLIGLSVLLCLLAVVCVINYMRKQFSVTHADYITVVELDEEGNEVSRSKRIRLFPPDKIDQNALRHVADYVERLVASASPHCSLIISTPDGSKACLIMREEEQLKIFASIHLTPSSPKVDTRFNPYNFPPSAPEPEKEQALLALFAELGIVPDQDVIHDYGGYANAVRDLRYPISNDVEKATQIIQRLLKEVYHIQEADALHFSFDERE